MEEKIRPLEWIGNSKKDYLKFPVAVQDEMGFALFRVQIGETHHKIKSLKGLGRGVQEIISNYQTNTYRAVYTVQFEDMVYMLSRRKPRRA